MNSALLWLGMSFYIPFNAKFGNKIPLYQHFTQEEHSDKSHLRVDDSVRIALIRAESLTGKEKPEDLCVWKETIFATAASLGECGLKSELAYRVAKIERVELAGQPKSANDIRRVKICAGKGRAYFAARAVVNGCANKSYDTGFRSYGDRAYGHPLVGVFRQRTTAANNDTEQLVEQMMHFSLTDCCIPTCQLRGAAKKRVSEQFSLDESPGPLVVSPHEMFTVFRNHSKISGAQEKVVLRFDVDSQLANMHMLALQPLDLHDNNMGFCISRDDPMANKVRLYDHEYSMYSSNTVLFYRSNPLRNICDRDPFPYTTLHIVPIRSFLLQLQTATLPCHDHVVHKLLETECEQGLIAWLEHTIVSYEGQLGKEAAARLKALVFDAMARVEKKNAERQKRQLGYSICHSELCKQTVELIMEERNSELFRFIKIIMKQIKTQEKSILYSLFPRCSLGVLAAFKERMVNRRRYLEDCKRVAQGENDRDTLLEIVNRKSTPIPTTTKNTLCQETDTKKLLEDLAKWMVPTYRSIACAMYPLLADTLAVVEAIGAATKHAIGNFQTPLESVVYTYLQRCGGLAAICSAELRSARDQIKNKKPSIIKTAVGDAKPCQGSTSPTDVFRIMPMRSLKTIYQKMKEQQVSIPLAQELEHIFTAILDGEPAFFLDTITAIHDPDRLK